MGYQAMNLSVVISQRVEQLLSALTGSLVCIERSEPVTEGWSAQFGWPWVTRCTLKAETDTVPGSVIVKLRHQSIPHRCDPHERFVSEQSALAFLTMLGSAAGPHLLAADNEAGILMLEDLGAGLALEDMLLGSDASLARHGLVAFATALGQMHVSTIGHAQEYYQLKSACTAIDATNECIRLAGNDLRDIWQQLRLIAASHSYPPLPIGIEKEVDEMLCLLAEPGPYLAFSNGDISPSNCRLTETGIRFLDFENASFHHALLDVAMLRFPFPACPCWAHLPEDAGRAAEVAYREQMARACPGILDSTEYMHGLTVACAAWTILRMVRLPKLERVDEPQPMGFSRRGQLLDTIATTVDCARQSGGSLPGLASWLVSVSEVLRERWPQLPPTQLLYPAFR